MFLWKAARGSPVLRRRMYAMTATSSPRSTISSSNYNNTGRSWFSSASTSAVPDETDDEPRESMPFDVLIVGGGPAGLAASIRLKQLCQETGRDLSVCVIDKGSEIGSHILSGNVFDPRAMHELFPEQHAAGSKDKSWWTESLLETTGSYATPVTHDQFSILTSGGGGSVHIPGFFLPPQLNNHGNYIISLSNTCRWLATQAEAVGVEIYPGFAASDVLLDEGGTRVTGIATRDVGLAKDGSRKSTFARGVELKARQTLFAEGARGSCTEFLLQHFGLRTPGVHHPQTYGIGLKEVWQVPPEQFQAGFVQHTVGWPLQSGPFSKTFGGSFLYHQEPDLVLIGLVVGLDYANPYLNPYQEFQRWKTHPLIAKHLQGGQCISYGARVLNEGGYHALPQLTFPGGMLLGCGAGFLNAVKIKGTHTAMKSGILAAETVHAALTAPDQPPSVAETGELPTTTSAAKQHQLEAYETSIRNSWVHDELYAIRNTHEAFARWGVGAGMVYTALSSFITHGREPWTLRPSKTRDCDGTQPAANHQPIVYPPPDGQLTFDLLTNLQRSGVYHEDDQPIHLRIKPQLAHVPETVSLQKYAAPESRFCPAQVYEYVPTPSDHGKEEKKLVINAQNCVHCKACSIKTPQEFIQWTVPEGGGGPQYQNM